MRKLIQEIHRRSLWQILGLYLAGSWIALQVVNEIADSVGLPEWVSPAAIILLVLGFPVVLATAFVQEGLGDAGRRADPERARELSGSRPESAGGGPTSEGSSGPDPVWGHASASAPGSTPGGATARRSGAHHRLFTWRNAVLGGVGAFALLGLATGGYMAMRVLGIGPAGTLVAKGVLDERDRIVLADFDAREEDAELAETVTEALRVDLARSRVVRLTDPAFVAQALSRMGRDAEAPLDAQTARELAQREGIKAVLAGDVAPAGSGYFLTASLLSPSTGAILTSERVTASDPDEIIGAIEDLSKSLRERVGESLRTIRGEEPLEQVTTGDLEALRKYTQAVRIIEGPDYRRGIELLEEAVARDTTFAMAFRKLGMELFNRGEERKRAIEALTRAYEYRERLTERERYLAEAAYYDRIRDEPERVVGAYLNMLALDPDDPWALNNLGVKYSDLRQYSKAEEYYERASAVDSAGLFSHTNTVIVEVFQGKLEEARATLDRTMRRHPDAWLAQMTWAVFPTVRGDWDEAERRVAELRPEWRSQLFLRQQASSAAAALAGLQGRLGEAEREIAEVEAIQGERGLAGEALDAALWPAWYDLGVRDDRAGAIRRVEGALEAHPLDGIEPEDRPYFTLAQLYAIAGRPERARSMVEQFRASVAEDVQAGATVPVERALAQIALAEGRPEEAIERERRASARTSCPHCGLPRLIEAYEALGRPDSVLAILERYVGTTAIYRFYWDQTLLGPYYERLARMYDEGDDLENAAKYYAMLVELWADADAELQPRVRAAQERLEQIVAERG